MSDPMPCRRTITLAFAAGILLAVPLPGRADPPAAAGPQSAAPQSANPVPDNPVPPRIGNRWDNLDHQPRQADVGAAEQELGVARSAEHDRAVDNELQQLGNQLLNAEQNGPAANGR